MRRTLYVFLHFVFLVSGLTAMFIEGRHQTSPGKGFLVGAVFICIAVLFRSILISMHRHKRDG